MSSAHYIHDPDAVAENPVSAKYHKLARDLLRGLVDPNLRPNLAERESIDAVVHDPSNVLSTKDADLLWKFRHSLTGNKKALTKFLMCVDWDVESEVKQALELLERWAAIDIEDALRLLAPEYANRAVRKFAVDTLSRASDEELSCYLLQLVSALRFETWAEYGRGDDADADAGDGAGAGSTSASTVVVPGAKGMRMSPLATLLVRRAARSKELATFFHWFLTVELHDNPTHGKMYHFVHEKFLNELESTPGGTDLSRMLGAQADLVGRLQAATHEATSNRQLKLAQKTKKLNELLSEEGSYGGLLNLLQPVVLPVNPSVTVVGVVPGKCKVFGSVQAPVMINFFTLDKEEGTEESKATSEASMPAPDASTSAVTAATPEPQPERSVYSVMIKMGDDIRQDQLILQLFRLMDFQLKKVNVDLKLNPYPVLATNSMGGMVEIVRGAHDVSDVLKAGNILSFFRKHHPDPSATHGVKEEVMDTYVRSCAGYCVMTYLLGIGDRHNENVMLKNDGHFFHIDFGWIFGRDPKPYPPPMKLTKEMIEGMGGPRSENYITFKRHACDAYNELRKSANLVLNLLRLMQGCSIQDLQTDADTTILKVQEKFRLDISREEAERVFLALIDESVTALFPILLEGLHKLAVMWRMR